MICREIKDGEYNKYVSEEERRLQRLIFDSLKDNDIDNLRSAFDSFYNLTYLDLKRQAFFKLNNIDEAEDVVLDTYSDLFKAIVEGKCIQHLKAYLYSIFLYKCMAYNTKDKSRIANEIHLSESSEYYDTDDFVIHIELSDLINRTLTPQEKYIVIHYVIRGERLEDIKKKLKLEHVDMYKIYKKIVKKLRKGVILYEQ